MIGGMIKSKDESEKKISEDEIKQLREKFKEIVGASPQGTAAGGMQKTSRLVNATDYSQKGGVQSIEVVDPERVIDNERITNLIMQQIKELIEVDNNINSRIKEVEGKIDRTSYSLTEMKNNVERFNERLDFIEKNMEKFMGLYEVVTNIFNPFTENAAPDFGVQQISQQQNASYIDTSSKVSDSGTVSANAYYDAASSFSQKAAERDAKKISSAGTAATQAPETKEIIIDKPQANTIITAKEASPADIADSHNKSGTANETALQKTFGIIDKNEDSFRNTIVPADFHFTLPDGSDVKSVNDLISAVRKMDENSFARFVNEESHDFAEWIRLATGNKKKADALEKLKKKEDFLAELER